MKKQRSLYTITTEDVASIASQENISFDEKDMPFIEDKIGDYFGDKWQDAILYALEELSQKK